MCAQFIIKTTFRDLSKKYGFVLPDDIFEDSINERVLPYQFAPVIVNVEGHYKLRPMNFSLIPSWNKEKRVKYATHNARLKSVDEKTGATIYIHEKPTWRDPFKRTRCVVPITDFIEPIYEGPFAGNMVDFFSTDHQILSAAGIWSTWTDQSSGEVLESFAIITNDPSEFVLKTGHDRQPIFLNETAIAEWLNPKLQDPQKLISLLDEGAGQYPLDVKIDRPLKQKKTSSQNLLFPN